MRRVQERRAARTLTLRGAARARLVLAGIAAIVLVADQATKTWAVHRLRRGPIHIVGPVDLRLTYNTGGAFGLGGGRAPFFMAAAVVLVVVLVRLGRADRGLLPALALGLLVGGAAGNLSDRIFRHAAGGVVDFVRLGWWPTFNVADAAITCGGLLLVLTGWRRA